MSGRRESNVVLFGKHMVPRDKKNLDVSLSLTDEVICPNRHNRRSKRNFHSHNYYAGGNIETWRTFDSRLYSDLAVTEEEEVDYVTANCQLLINSGTGDEEVYRNPDLEIPWSDVMGVRCFQTEASSCPICLETPILPRMGPCGHVYCYPCAKSYISFENDSESKKCAVCDCELKMAELKRVYLYVYPLPKVNDVIDLDLMRRPKKLIFPTFAQNEDSDPSTKFLSRLAIVDSEETARQIRHEIKVMEIYARDCEAEDSNSISANSAKYILRKLRAEEKNLGTTTSCGENQHNSTDLNPQDCYHYYQQTGGCDVYLHSINWRCLTEDFETSELPLQIRGKVLEIENHTMSSALRKRYRHLNHLPLGRTFHIVEIELESPIITPETLNKFSEQLSEREIGRMKRMERENQLTQAKKEAEDRIPTLPAGARFLGYADLSQQQQEVPTEDDFIPLEVAMARTSLNGHRGKSTSLRSPPSPQPQLRRSFASVTSCGAEKHLDSHRVANFPKLSDIRNDSNAVPAKSVPLLDFLTEAAPKKSATSIKKSNDTPADYQQVSRRNKRRAKRAKKAAKNTSC